MAYTTYTTAPRARKHGCHTQHTQLIADLCSRDSEIQKRGFWRAVDALTEELDFLDPVRRQHFLPDAFKINRETQELEIHEVVRTHDVSATKLLMMGCLWGEFDGEQEEWYPVLFIHREGFSPRRIELCDVYLDVVRLNARARLNAEVQG